jgi:hypothetical protein
MSTEKSVLEWQVEPEEIEEWVDIESESGFDPGSLEAEIESAQEKLTALADNWDGEGSAEYSKETINNAAEFLMSQDLLLRKICGMSLPVPQINPGPDGSIDLFWKQPTWELLVNVPANSNQAASFYGEDQTGHTIKGSLDTSEPNLGVIVWLMKK